MRKRPQTTTARQDFERQERLDRMPLKELQDKLPGAWKERREAARRQIQVPIPGSSQYS